jgi:hypothetical protein
MQLGFLIATSSSELWSSFDSEFKMRVTPKHLGFHDLPATLSPTMGIEIKSQVYTDGNFSPLLPNTSKTYAKSSAGLEQNWCMT